MIWPQQSPFCIKINKDALQKVGRAICHLLLGRLLSDGKRIMCLLLKPFHHWLQQIIFRYMSETDNTADCQ